MCKHKSLAEKSADNLADYYSAAYGKVMAEIYSARYHENGYDHLPGPVLTAGKADELQMFHWGLVHSDSKGIKGDIVEKRKALQLQSDNTILCRSEEMYEKFSYQKAISKGQRCLIPATGFFEWQWKDSKGKEKIPYHIGLRDSSLFSIAGIYDRWKDPETGDFYYSYTMLTTAANKLMSEIHNSGLRMPVIIKRENEKDWLDPKLSRDDVLSLCKAVDDSILKAYTISKLIGQKGANTNVPEVLRVFRYQEDLKLF